MQTSNETVIQKDIHHVITKWDEKMHFESVVNDHLLHLDKLQQHNGDNKGPRPKPLILSALGGCMGMEIISVLSKMRIGIDVLEIDVTAELTDRQPKIYKSVHVIYKIKSREQENEKIQRAIYLVEEKYCGVIAMVRHFAVVTSEIQYL